MSTTAKTRQDAVLSPETDRTSQMGKVFGYLKGLHATHAIDLGVRLGLFERLAGGPAVPDELAAGLGLHAPYVRLWCQTACALELLDFDPDRGYLLAPHMDEVLARPQGTFYLGGFPQAHLQVARDYARYPELFARGAVFPYQEHDEPFLRSVAGATRSLPRMFLDAVLPGLPAIRDSLQAGATVLDLGCGAGYALVEFAERFPAVYGIGIDVEPASVQMAAELLRERGLTDRVTVHHITGAENWPVPDGSVDLVTTFLVLHEIEPSRKDAVIARCARALKPGGRLLIFDERYPSRLAELRDPVQIYAVMAQWYELTWGNVIDTAEDIVALVRRHGFEVVDETSLSRFYVLTACTPQRVSS